MSSKISFSDTPAHKAPNYGALKYATTGNTELLSMAAGLAVGKPGDTASISADSALGRSSVVTGTTAGMTQLSEVSQITDCYWSGLF